LHSLVDEVGQLRFAHASSGRFGLLGSALQQVGAHGLLDEARQVAFATATLRGDEHAHGLIHFRRHSDVPANGVHGVLLFRI